jgi:hypothetical protein
VNGKRVPSKYDYLIDGRLQGIVYLDYDDNKTWIVDSGGSDRSWSGPVKSLADGKALIIQKAGPNGFPPEPFLVIAL